jgi:RNase P/RNase MRP subunit p29
MNRSIALVVLAAAALGVAGCVTHETRPQTRINATQASQEIPQDQLLDVAVKLFEENTPTDEKKLEKEHIFPEVRKAEARYFPMQIRNTLEGSGQWGQVRVIPADTNALDVQVTGKIIESNGQLLRIDIAVADATGRLWFRREYQQTADTRSYKDQSGQPRDPFQNLYSTLANDMLTYRQQLLGADLENVRRVSELRFAQDLAPYAFQSYLAEDKKKGVYQVVRLPADGDPLLQRMDRIRERDYALLDTVDEHYSLFAENMAEPYTNWRRYSYAELEAEDEAKRSALTRKLLGAAAIVGGLVVGSEANTYAGQAAATGAIFGGAYAIKSGFDKGAEVKMHSDSLKQLGESFQAEVQPMVVEVEGRTCCARPDPERRRRVSALDFFRHETSHHAGERAGTVCEIRSRPTSGDRR